jgi:enoyl-CoA hydratase
MAEPVIVRREGPVTIVQIDRPHVRNAVDARTAAALREAWLDFTLDDTARVGVLSGGNDVFSAGADLSALRGLAPAVAGAEGPLGFTRLLLDKPVIAAVAGYCVAGGLEMACWCDLRVADETALFGCLERRYGVPLVDGGTQRLPRIIGLGRALDLILTGRIVAADEALQMGLVNEVVPAGESLSRAIALAQQLAAFPQACLCHDRLAVYEGLGLSLQEGLKVEAAHGEEVLASGEPAAGAAAFLAARETAKGKKDEA